MLNPKKKLTQVHSSDTKYLVYAKATYYHDFVRVWIPNKPYIHQKEGYESPAKAAKVREKNTDEDSYETNAERSIRRTRKAIKDYVLMNDFDLFSTFTFASDRYNAERSRKRLATWLKNQRTRNGKFRYIVVPEHHKDGALHFHALIGSYTGKMKLAINPNTNKMISDGRGDYVRNFAEYNLGINSAKVISGNQGKTKTAYYLQKYITKETLDEFGKNRYWVSHGLARPAIEENPEPFYKHYEADRHWVIDHGTVLEFDRHKHPLIDMFIEAHE